MSRVARMVLARLKRLAAAPANSIRLAWVFRGSRVFLFRKGANSRMGKGVGSFHSSRREVVAGSLLCLALLRRGLMAGRAKRYIRARFSSRTLCRLITLQSIMSKTLYSDTTMRRHSVAACLRYGRCVRNTSSAGRFRFRASTFERRTESRRHTLP